MSDWTAPLGRAIPALIIAVVITFSADHSPSLGLVAFGIFAIVASLATAALVWRGRDTSSGRIQLVQAGLTLAAGLAAVSVAGGGLPYLVFLLALWAALTGMLELWHGLRTRRTEAAARDRLFAGGLTALFAVAVLLVPPGLAQPYVVDGSEFVLTASIVVVGLFGAYAAILGVFLVIGALSVKWTTPAPLPTPASLPTHQPTEASS